jgi:site-specific DNA-methyltransferase (adenine-specific)
MAVFAGTRTADLMGLSIRLAGFEMCDTITWMYSSGFPKSRNIGKEVIDFKGWGTGLKPASEPIIVARKPFKGTYAANMLAHGTGGMNIDACRVTTKDKLVRPAILRNDNEVYGKGLGNGTQEEPGGRWPANVVLSHSEDCTVSECVEGCVIVELDKQSGILANCGSPKKTTHNTGMFGIGTPGRIYSDSGGASRFYNIFRYQAKAPKSERPLVNGKGYPTVKPQALIEWLITLFTSPDGLIVDPFAGTGTTGRAALKLGFSSILMDNNPKAYPFIDQKLNDYLATIRPVTPTWVIKTSA